MGRRAQRHREAGNPARPSRADTGHSVQVDVYQQVDGEWERQWALVTAGQATGGRFAVTGLRPGVYRLYLHDGSVGNRAIAPRTVEATIDASGVVDLGPIVVTFLEPGDEPEPANLDDLDELIVAALSGRVSTGTEFDEGDDIEVVVGDDFAGEWVSFTANSTPQALLGGWVQVGADGVARSALPAGFSGEHRLVVQDADGQVIGWTPIAVTAAVVVTPTNPTNPVTPITPGTTSTNSSGGKKSVTTAAPAEEAAAPPADSPAEPAPEPEETEAPAEPSDGGDTSGGSAAGDSDVAVTSADPTWFIAGGIALIIIIGAAVGGTVIMRRRA